MTVIEQEKPSTAPKSGILVPRVLEEVLTFFHRQSISYCYWKSGLRIQSALCGDSDVDLLVALKDMHRMELVLLKQGFKRVTTLASSDHWSDYEFSWL